MKCRFTAAHSPRRPPAALAAQLLANLTRASEEAVQVELRLRLQDALNSMDPLDREVLALRHFEQLSPAETARVLGIKEKAAGMRYVRALRRLREMLNSLSAGWAGALNMIDSLSGSDLLNELAHEFAERYRRGERPPVNEYTDRYPDLAGEIRDLFPTLVMMEQFGSGVENRSVPVARRPRVDEPMPERLGDYRILREIGRGGMGIVYEAVQESLGRQVALKVLSQYRQLGAIQLLRFEREAKAAALLHHTNIVPVFGVGEHQGVHYYAMQYIEGQSLDKVLAEIQRASRWLLPGRRPGPQ